MRIYTRSGDKGTTSLIYGQRVAKNDLRVEAYGTCDEANSMIGFALSQLPEHGWLGQQAFTTAVRQVQTVLFHVGAELATPLDKEVQWKLEEKHIQKLEDQIDKWEEELPELKNFILPSGHPSAAALHVARTIVRRAERLVIGLEDQIRNPLVIAYLNRLSDFLFVAARYVNSRSGGKETELQTDS